MLIVAVMTMPQTSLHALYGKSDSEVFNVRPGILLSVEYGEDGEACAMRIEPQRDPSSASWLDAPSADMNKMTEVLDEVVPPNQRGKEVGPGPFFGIHCYGAATPIEYENVIINSYYHCEKPVKFSGFEVRFKRPACDKVKPETFPPPGSKSRCAPQDSPLKR
jgi:hypothetical protein